MSVCVSAAGTYGVLTLFGILPAAMAWQARYGATTQQQQQQDAATVPLQAFQPLLPGGAPALVAVGGAAAAVVLYELLGVVTGQ